LATSLRDMACHRSRGPGSDGKTESISIDTRMGTYSSQASDGAVTVTHIFEAPGPLYHKVKSVDRIDRNKLTIVYKASYDEFGRLIRKIDSNGLVTTFQYDLTGHEVSHHMSLSSDPIFLASIAAQEQALLKQLKSASTSSERDAVLENLIIFYTAKSLQFDKAEALLKTVTNRNDIYTLKLCLALNPNHALAVRSLDLNKLIQEFPDKKSFTENLQFQ
jgi:YD repeat-containing protein